MNFTYADVEGAGDVIIMGTNRNTRKFSALQVMLMMMLMLMVVAAAAAAAAKALTRLPLQCHRHVTLLLHDYESSRNVDLCATRFIFSELILSYTC
jgi:hypothetical protein